MDQQKIGSLMKELRKEKDITQEGFAEVMGVSNRTVSRWETGRNMPDLSILVEIADYYDVDIRELFDGERGGEETTLTGRERRSEDMEQDVKETALKAADYSNEERKWLMKKLHVFSWIGVAAFTAFIVLEAAGLADGGVTERIADLCCGFAFGILVVAVIYTNPRIYGFMAWKRKLFRRK